MKFDFNPYHKLKIYTPALAGSYKSILDAKMNPDKLQEKFLIKSEKDIENKKKLNLRKKSRTEEMMSEGKKMEVKKRKLKKYKRQ